MRRNEEQLFLALTLIIGVVVDLTIVAFVVLTERVGLRLYPVEAQPWRRLFMVVMGSVDGVVYRQDLLGGNSYKAAIITSFLSLSELFVCLA